MSGAGSEGGDREQGLKELLRRLHEGANPAELKEDFKRVLGTIPPSEIAQIEQGLIEAGISRDEIRSLCDVHLEVMRESLEAATIAAPGWHPLNTLIQEHNSQIEFAEEVRRAARELQQPEDLRSAAADVDQLVKSFELLEESESHFLREERVLFPYLEKHGITEPPPVMRMDHDGIRKAKKDLRSLLDSEDEVPRTDFASALVETTIALSEQLASHFLKENRILFPTALKVIGPAEWLEIRKQCDDLRYCSFTPKPDIPPREVAEVREPQAPERSMTLPSGSTSTEEI